ncbi:hypothetical protein D3C85_211280 [compost metagenome]
MNLSALHLFADSGRATHHAFDASFHLVDDVEHHRHLVHDPRHGAVEDLFDAGPQVREERFDGLPVFVNDKRSQADGGNGQANRVQQQCAAQPQHSSARHAQACGHQAKDGGKARQHRSTSEPGAARDVEHVHGAQHSQARAEEPHGDFRDGAHQFFVRRNPFRHSVDALGKPTLTTERFCQRAAADNREALQRPADLVDLFFAGGHHLGKVFIHRAAALQGLVLDFLVLVPVLNHRAQEVLYLHVREQFADSFLVALGRLHDGFHGRFEWIFALLLCVGDDLVQVQAEFLLCLLERFRAHDLGNVVLHVVRGFVGISRTLARDFQRGAHGGRSFAAFHLQRDETRAQDRQNLRHVLQLYVAFLAGHGQRVHRRQHVFRRNLQAVIQREHGLCHVLHIAARGRRGLAHNGHHVARGANLHAGRDQEADGLLRVGRRLVGFTARCHDFVGQLANLGLRHVGRVADQLQLVFVANRLLHGRQEGQGGDGASGHGAADLAADFLAACGVRLACCLQAGDACQQRALLLQLARDGCVPLAHAVHVFAQAAKFLDA